MFYFTFIAVAVAVTVAVTVSSSTVCPSVCVSVKCVNCNKTKKVPPRFLYHMRVVYRTLLRRKVDGATPFT